MLFMKVEKMVLNTFKNGIFPILPKKGTGVPGMQDSRSIDLASSSSLKILTPKQMLQRLPIALPQTY